MSIRAAVALVRLRTVAEAEARLGLAASLRSEAEAEAALRRAIDEMAAQAEAAADLDAGDVVVEAFGAWLPHGRARREVAEGALAAAGADTARARAVLAAAKAACEAACALRDRLADERRAALDRAEQHAADDAARARAGDAEGGRGEAPEP